MIRIEYADLLNKPFKRGGRGPAEYDCYGLLRECARRAHEPVPPDYPTPNHDAGIAWAMLQGVRKGWEKLDRVQPNCVAWMRMDRRTATHVVWMLDTDYFLHALAETKFPTVERLSNPLWQRRVVGFYRYAPV